MMTRKNHWVILIPETKKKMMMKHIMTALLDTADVTLLHNSFTLPHWANRMQHLTGQPQPSLHCVVYVSS
jgi:hypothetical protein